MWRLLVSQTCQLSARRRVQTAWFDSQLVFPSRSGRKSLLERFGPYQSACHVVPVRLWGGDRNFAESWSPSGARTLGGECAYDILRSDAFKAVTMAGGKRDNIHMYMYGVRSMYVQCRKTNNAVGWRVGPSSEEPSHFSFPTRSDHASVFDRQFPCSVDPRY